MKKLFLIIAALLLTFPIAAQDKSVITGIMKRQESHWNNGDIPAFMEDYWKSPELKFIGKNGVTKGWEATRDRYLRS
ncbi:MAG: DUF4440 domain-containing protein, partial [Leadbetterella sp.]|nr:DUF4440 domain-containing protein [Leadbetterella sp.]